MSRMRGCRRVTPGFSGAASSSTGSGSAFGRTATSGVGRPPRRRLRFRNGHVHRFGCGRVELLIGGLLERLVGDLVAHCRLSVRGRVTHVSSFAVPGC